MKTIIITLILALSSVVSSFAAKAVGTPHDYKQPDGTTVTLRLLGDEYFTWLQTNDGVLVVQDSDCFYVATVAGYHELKSSGVIAHNNGQRTTAEVAVIGQQDNDRATFFVSSSYSVENPSRSKKISYSYNNRICPHSGTVTIPVILVYFKDSTFKVGAKYDGKGAVKETLPSDEKVIETFEKYFNNADAEFKLGSNSVAKFFKDASHGNFDMKFELHGPYQLPYAHSYYGHRSSTSNNLFPHALTAVDPYLNFSAPKYDINKDGCVDMVCVLYAGGGANITNTGNAKTDPNDFWPCCYSGNYNASRDGVNIYVIGAFPELAGYPESGDTVYARAGVGVTCHELSHGLGMPDLYDTNTSITRSNYNDNGPEYWDLMDGGENINRGYYPCQYLAWEKDYFGWKKAIELTEPSTVTLRPVNEGGEIYKVVNPADTTEYYIIEAAQTEEWNSGLYRYLTKYGKCTKVGGLLVEHVSKSAKTSLSPNNEYSNGYQPSLTLIPADGVIVAETGIGTAKPGGGKYTAYDFFESLAGDPYPGTGGVTSLKAYKNYSGSEMVYSHSITDITQNEDGSITFKYRNGESTAIKDIALNSEHSAINQNRIFTIDGRYVGMDKSVLPQGIYIMNGHKFVK